MGTPKPKLNRQYLEEHDADAGDMDTDTAATLHTEYLNMCKEEDRLVAITDGDMGLLHSRFKSMLQWSPLAEPIPEGAEALDVMETAIAVLTDCYVLNRLAELMADCVESAPPIEVSGERHIFQRAIYASGPVLVCTMRDNISTLARLRWKHWDATTEVALNDALEASADVWSVMLASAMATGLDVGAMPPTVQKHQKLQAMYRELISTEEAFTHESWGGGLDGSEFN